MSERILIVDDVVTTRIVLKVRLSAAAYEVAQATCPASALDWLARGEFGLVILAGALARPGPATGLLGRIAAVAGAPPVLVLGQGADPQARLRVLAAGAAECLPAALDGASLLAHLRALMRRGRPLAGDFAPPPGPAPACALDEAPATFRPAPGVAPAARVALITSGPQEAMTLRASLGRLLHEPLDAFRPGDALTALRSGAPPAAIVISIATGEGEVGLDDLHLLAEIRARAALSDVPVLVLGIADAARRILALDLGAHDVLPPGAAVEELALRLHHCLAESRWRARREQERDEELRLASTDPLTGLANRRGVFRGLDALHAGARAGQGYALLLLDIDRFKQVNDRLGHVAGDRVLVEVAARLAAVVARAAPGALLGRVGGEEFLVAVPGLDPARARALAESLRRAIVARPFRLAGQGPVRVTISVGLSLVEGAGSLDEAYGRADRALYAAKAAGRNAVEIARPAA